VPHRLLRRRRLPQPRVRVLRRFRRGVHRLPLVEHEHVLQRPVPVRHVGGLHAGPAVRRRQLSLHAGELSQRLL
jgi:hypothetical protein